MHPFLMGDKAIVMGKRIDEELSTMPPGTQVKKSALRLKYNIPHNQSALVWIYLETTKKYRDVNNAILILQPNMSA